MTAAQGNAPGLPNCHSVSGIEPATAARQCHEPYPFDIVAARGCAEDDDGVGEARNVVEDIVKAVA